MPESERISRNGLYPVVDSIPGAARLGFTPKGIALRNSIRAKWTGERRPPRRGEWFLSGAIIEAYRALADLRTSYHIARLVRTKTETVTTVLGPYPAE